MSKKDLKANKNKNKDKTKTKDEMDFGVSIEGMQRFLELEEFSEEEIEACVEFFEKFVHNDFPKYLKAQKTIRTYVNAVLCVGDEKLRDQRIEVLGRIDQFTIDLADFRCRFSDGF